MMRSHVKNGYDAYSEGKCYYFMLCLHFRAPAGSTNALPHSKQVCSFTCILRIKNQSFQTQAISAYPLMSLHMNNKVLTLPELFRAQSTLELLQVQVKLFMDLQHLSIVKAFAAAFPFTFELSLPRVSDHVTFQGVFVGAPLSAFWTNDFCLIVMLSHFVTQQC